MRLLRRILMGWRITLPIGGRRIAVPVILTSLLLCCGASLVGTAIDSGMRQAGLLPTYTPTATRTVAPTSTPRPTATATEISTSTSVPTATAVPTDTPAPTATSEPTATSAPIPTDTPRPAPTALPPPPPTVAVRAAPAIVLPSPASSSCDCSDNLYNCSDFIVFDAQSCYMRCLELTGRDVHDLDRDHDGSACEWEY